jgi:hypothetical protein
MVRRSKKNRRGGERLDDIQSQLNDIQSQLNEMKSSSSSSMSDSMPESMTESMTDSMSEPMMESVKVDKTWVNDKNKKFRDGDGGRVSLSFNRIMTLLDTNIKKGDKTKDWSTIKEKLTDANSLDELQDVIDKYKMNFGSNYIAGTRRRKRHGKKRTHRRR